MLVKKTTKRKIKRNLTLHKRMKSKNGYRHNKKTKRVFRKKGGMWRITQKNFPEAELVSETIESAYGRPYTFDDPVLPVADVEIINNAVIDNKTREEQLNDIYDEIRSRGFPLYSNEKNALLKKYPEFDVNITVGGKTLLDEALFQSTPKLAEAVINSQTITRETLQNSLNYLSTFAKMNQSQSRIRHLIIQKLNTM